MSQSINDFQMRWKLIKDSCLSSLRRGIKGHIVDMNEVNYTFSRCANEWFSGQLAPALWFNSLKEEDPKKAEAFKSAVLGVKFDQKPYSPPSVWWTVLIGVMVAIATFCALYWFPLPEPFASWSLWVVIIISIGLGILFYYIFAVAASKNVEAYNELYVDKFEAEIDEVNLRLTEILETPSGNDSPKS